MAEFEPGHPDELVQTLRNWLAQAHSPEGTLLPAGIDPTEWAIRQFIVGWKESARRDIESVEESLAEAMDLCQTGAPHAEIQNAIDTARQTLQEDLRDHLGLYEWNKES